MNSFTIKNYVSSFVSSWDDTFVFNGESHSMCEIVFVDKGKVIVTEENTVYNLEENQMIIHAPMEFHCIKSAANSMPTVRVMSFNILGQLPHALTNGVFTLTSDEREDYLYTFEKAGKVCHEKPISEWDMEEATCRVIAFLIRISKTKAQHRTSLSPSAAIYQKIASFMEENITANFTIDEIARQNYVSKSYLKCLFRKYANTSPKQYDIHLKIKAADKRMQQGFSMREIAEDLKFSSPNYFSTFYKQHTGMTPLEFKRQFENADIFKK